MAMVSVQGKIKNKPGPFAPPSIILPNRKITARSYSFTIFIFKLSYLIIMQLYRTFSLLYINQTMNYNFLLTSLDLFNI